MQLTMAGSSASSSIESSADSKWLAAGKQAMIVHLHHYSAIASVGSDFTILTVSTLTVTMRLSRFNM